MQVWNDAMCKLQKKSDQKEMGDKVSYNLGEYFLLIIRS